MEIKIINLDELNQVMEIINQAKELLKKDSLQWQQGYPNVDTMTNDILNRHLYGYYIKNKLIGIVALIIGLDDNYCEIENGNWQIKANSNDLTIHRIAVRNEFHKQKIGDKLIKFSIEYARKKGIKSIKVDTHLKNISMQQILIKNNFTQRGIIYLKRDEIDNSRLAYELLI